MSKWLQDVGLKEHIISLTILKLKLAKSRIFTQISGKIRIKHLLPVVKQKWLINILLCSKTLTTVMFQDTLHQNKYLHINWKIIQISTRTDSNWKVRDYLIIRRLTSGITLMKRVILLERSQEKIHAVKIMKWCQYGTSTTFAKAFRHLLVNILIGSLNQSMLPQ